MYAGGATAYGYGGGPSGGFSSAYGLPASSISYETNSKDPILQRARVFVGNILTSKVGRDEIIQLFNNYGKLLGVTLFKGFAFVQFSHGNEADLAVATLNGYNWHGATLDVKLALHGQTPLPKGNQHVGGAGGIQVAAAKGTVGKRNKNEAHSQEAATKDLKRMKIDQAEEEKEKKKEKEQANVHTNINNINKEYAAKAENVDGIVAHDKEITDTLICGECRFVTSDLAKFVKHRKNPCKVNEKQGGEPELLGCISCDDQFTNSWDLLTHHNNAHIRPLYKAITQANGAKLDKSDDGIKLESDKSESGQHA